MNRKYPQTHIKMLYGKAAGRCAFPSCKLCLILEGTAQDSNKQIGKIAHIIAHGNTGPRADQQYPKEKLDTYENWILLCPTCHDKIDCQDNTYTPQYLRELKLNHEKWVGESLEDEIPYVGFAELEVALRGIALRDGLTVSGFSVITPEEKIAKNELSNVTRNLLVMGLMRSQEVESYITEMEKINPGFADSLSTCFKDKYQELCSEGLKGDVLFEALLLFASNGSNDFKIKAAGLALLSHLFEICEVFEK